MKKIGLSGIKIDKVCGFGAERNEPQRLEVDIEIETDFLKLAEKDNPDYGLNMNVVYNLISIAIEGEVYTIEAIALKIWKKLKSLELASWVRVVVKKPEPLLLSNVKYSKAVIEG